MITNVYCVIKSNLFEILISTWFYLIKLNGNYMFLFPINTPTNGMNAIIIGNNNIYDDLNASNRTNESFNNRVTKYIQFRIANFFQPSHSHWCWLSVPLYVELLLLRKSTMDPFIHHSTLVFLISFTCLSIPIIHLNI